MSSLSPRLAISRPQIVIKYLKWSFSEKMCTFSERSCCKKGYSSDWKRTMTFNFLPIRLCFINIYTYPNPKPTPYNYEKIVIIVVQCGKNYTVLMCACPVAPYISLLALIHRGRIAAANGGARDHPSERQNDEWDTLQSRGLNGHVHAAAIVSPRDQKCT